MACKPATLETLGNTPGPVPDTGMAMPDASFPPTDSGTPPADTGGTSPDTSTMPDTGAPDTSLPPDSCGDSRLIPLVHRGTAGPTITPIDEGQILAIGSINGCSATLVTPTWVVTATHCNARTGGQFCMGRNRELGCVRISRVIAHPDYNRPMQFAHDITMLELEQDATNVNPDVVPIPIMTEPFDSSWVGRDVEMSGYGQTETGGSNVRFFGVMEVTGMPEQFIELDGRGTGTCYGDSGGPVLVVASDGTVRLGGDASHIYGSPPTCGYYARYVRVDRLQDWIEGFTGPTVVGPTECEMVTEMGSCDLGRAIFCEDDVLQTRNCDRCGWDADAEGFRCIEGVDPCGGVDLQGVCDGDIARWCEGGVPKMRNCTGTCGSGCMQTGEMAAANCVE